MEISSLFGLPAHPLIVHAVVVLVPLAAVGAIAVVLSTWVRGHIGWLVAACAVASALLVPLATGSGESLEEGVPQSALLEKHTQMGEQLLPWVLILTVGIVVAMALGHLLSRRSSVTAQPMWAQRWVAIAIAVVTIVGAAGTLVQVARIGHSGAKATWSDVGSASGG